MTGVTSSRSTKPAFAFVALAALALSRHSNAADSPGAPGAPDPSLLTLDRIFTSDDFKGEDVAPVHWDEEGHGFTTLRDTPGSDGAEAEDPDDAGPDDAPENGAPAESEGVGEDEEDPEPRKDIVWQNPETGDTRVLVPSGDLVTAKGQPPLPVDGFSVSRDRRHVLIYTNSQQVWRRKSRGDYWVYSVADRSLRRLGGDVPGASLQFATFSPDGSRVAYVFRNNLYVQNLSDLAITQLTADGSDTVINGTFDWVYEEEFGLYQGFVWSPDSQRIAYWQIDDSGVGRFALVNNTDGPAGRYPEITSFAYPKVGTTNPSCRAGVVPAGGGETKWLTFPGCPRDYYISKLYWIEPEGVATVVARRLNRAQNEVVIWAADADGGNSRPVFEETTDTWFDDRFETRWFAGDSRFLWLTEGPGGFREAAVVKPWTDEAPERIAVPGGDVIALNGLDERTGSVYLTASPGAPARRFLFRWDGKNGCVRITPGGARFDGTNSYSLSGDGRFAVHRRSSFTSPETVALVELPSHDVVGPLAENKELKAAVAALAPVETTFSRVALEDGTELDYWMVTPPPAGGGGGRLPLIVHVYGEPAGQTVTDRWKGKTGLWHLMMVQRGFAVASIDSRGTSAPRGTAFRKAAHHKIGIISPDDQAAAVRALLRQHPRLDPGRVGVWGHSGGGSSTLHALFRFPDVYHAGIAIAFIADQRLYDTIYQERYMGVPPVNAEGYKIGSPITHAAGLEGDLFLIYGSADDNCHYQNCELLANRLVELGKPFEMLVYPNRRHGVSKPDGTSRHRFGAMTRFFERTLSP